MSRRDRDSEALGQMATLFLMVAVVIGALAPSGGSGGGTAGPPPWWFPWLIIGSVVTFVVFIAGLLFWTWYGERYACKRHRLFVARDPRFDDDFFGPTHTHTGYRCRLCRVAWVEHADGTHDGYRTY